MKRRPRSTTPTSITRAQAAIEAARLDPIRLRHPTHAERLISHAEELLEETITLRALTLDQRDELHRLRAATVAARKTLVVR